MQLHPDKSPSSGMLQLPEYFFQLLVEASADALLVMDERGLIVFANARAGRVFGYQPDELLKRPMESLIPGDLHSRVAGAVGVPLPDVRGRMAGDELDLRGRRGDGSEFAMEVGLSPLKTHRGSLVIVSVRDLSEQRRVERRERDRARVLELLNSGAPLQEVLEFTVRAVEAEMPGCIGSILLLDESGRHLRHGAAPNLPEFFNQSADGIEIGEGVGSCGSAAFLGKLVIVEDIYTHPYWAPYVGLAEKAGVRACWSQPIFSADKKVLGTFAIYHREPCAPEPKDIETIEAAASYVNLAVSRKRSEEALRASEATLHAIIHNTPNVAVELYDLEGHVCFWNEAATRIFGWEIDDAIGKTLDQLIHTPEEAAAFVKLLRQIAGTGQPYGPVEYHFKRRDGAEGWCLSTVFEIPGFGGGPMFVCMDVDVTERRQIEERLRQSQKMEAIGQLAGGVAHDFNNILAAIMIEVELAATARNLPPEARESLQVIGGAADKAAALTRQLLTFSRRQVMQPRRLDINAVVTTLAKMLQRILGEDVKVQLLLHPSPLLTHADAGMLDQVVMNLAVNARDAMPNGGRLIIETSERHIAEEELRASPEASAGHHVCLSVSDSGVGMTEEVKAHLFEPFFTTKQPGKGTGLGLATIFGVVKQHRGWIHVYSEIGQGSTFRIFLPACEPGHAVTNEAHAAGSVRGGAETILLVEDEASVRDVTRRMLERHGYTVLEAVSGAEALRVWGERGDSIDLVFTDVVMPGGIGGRELAEQLWLIQPHLKIAFTSGYSAELAGSTIQLQEGVNFVQKPSTVHEVLGTIRKCLDGV